MNEENGLPRGWVETTLGDVTAPMRISVQPKEFPTLPFVGMEHVEAETMKLISTVPASELKSNAVRFWPGDVLYGRLRPYLNKVLRPDFEGLCSAEFLVFRESPHLNSRYFQYFLNSWSFKEFASHLNEGDRPRVDWSQLQGFQFPLPPLAEQQRIVAAIEQQFSRLDAGVSALRRAQAKLKRYRAAVLKAAVEGKLTEAWRAEHPAAEPASKLLERILAERRAKWEADLKAKGKNPAKVRYVEPARPDVDGLPELPEGWVWVKIGELFDISYGLSESLSKTEADNELDVPVIRIPNITEFGRLDLSAMKYFPLSEDKKRSLMVHKGDVLFNWRNAPKWIGRSAVFDKDGEFVNASFLLKLSPHLIGYSHFVSAYLNYLRISGYFLTRITNAVNQANFNASMTREIEIPLPPLAEQSKISAEVERCLSIADEIEVTIATNLKRAERLRQSILKEAFAGRLVPQDPDDEPASMLLERIRADREKRKHGALDKGRMVICEIPKPEKIDVSETKQVELWESGSSGE